jgi:hypothetical protein
MHNKTIKPDWIIDLDEARRDRTVKLLMESVHDEGMLGFEEADELKAKIFVADLAGRLNDNDCWLLQADAGNDLAYSVVMERCRNPTGAHIPVWERTILDRFRWTVERLMDSMPDTSPLQNRSQT